jgi:hypothetical protein
MNNLPLKMIELMDDYFFPSLLAAERVVERSKDRVS